MFPLYNWMPAFYGTTPSSTDGLPALIGFGVSSSPGSTNSGNRQEAAVFNGVLTSSSVTPFGSTLPYGNLVAFPYDYGGYEIACNGDSGGPLLQRRYDSAYVSGPIVGVLSTGYRSSSQATSLEGLKCQATDSTTFSMIDPSEVLNVVNGGSFPTTYTSKVFFPKIPNDSFTPSDFSSSLDLVSPVTSKPVASTTTTVKLTSSPWLVGDSKFIFLGTQPINKMPAAISTAASGTVLASNNQRGLGKYKATWQTAGLPAGSYNVSVSLPPNANGSTCAVYTYRIGTALAKPLATFSQKTSTATAMAKCTSTAKCASVLTQLKTGTVIAKLVIPRGTAATTPIYVDMADSNNAGNCGITGDMYADVIRIWN